MNTSFSFLILLFLYVNCQNDYHNLLNRYHELMNEELLEESPSLPLQREYKEGSSIIADRSTFHSPPSQSMEGLHGRDMRLPPGLLIKLVNEGEKRRAARLSKRVLRQ